MLPLKTVQKKKSPFVSKNICTAVTLGKLFFLYLFQVERVEVKDVRLPLQLQRAMAAEAEATREARAKVRN